MKEYKEKSSFRHLDIIGDVYVGLLLGLIIFISVYFYDDGKNHFESPIWVDGFVLFNMILVSLAGGVRERRYGQWDKTIWIDKDEQIIEVEFCEGFFLRYNFRRIPFSDLDIKLPRVRVGSKPSNRVIYEIRIFDKEELVTIFGWSDKWTNGGFDELVAEFSSIKEEYCEKKTDVQM